MERNPFFLVAAGLAFWAAVWGGNQPARAALCGKCRELMFVDSDGKCAACGAPTTSSALQLCPKCSAKRHQCEHCLGPTTEKDEAASQGPGGVAGTEKPHSGEPLGSGTQSGDPGDNPAPAWIPPGSSASPVKSNDAAATGPGLGSEAPPPAAAAEAKPPAELASDSPPPRLKPINPAREGTYTSGRWRYQMQITGPGTRTEGRWGWLTYDGQKLPRGEINDYYKTPWGPMFWVDVPSTAWGGHGWMPIPATQNRRQGRPLALPEPTAARAEAPPRPTQDSPPARSAGVLEINKSHNGQVAKLRVGHVLVIRLPGDPATGYQWRAATTNSPAMRLTVRPQYSPPRSTSQRAAGTYTFTFQAVQPGSGSIRLFYVRPNDPARPRDSFTVGVSVSPTATAARSAAGASPTAR